MLATALDSRKTVALYLGDLPVLRRVLAELGPIVRRRGDGFLRQFVLVESAVARGAAGDWAEAVRYAEEGLALNRRIGQRSLESLLLALHAAVHSGRGDYAAAVATADRGVEIADELGSDFLRPWANLSLGSVLLDLADLDEATIHLERALAVARGSGQSNISMRAAGLLAWAGWMAGDRERACESLRVAEATIGRVRAPLDKAYLLGADGQLAAARVHLGLGNTGAATRIAAPLLGAAEAAGWPARIAEAALVLAGCDPECAGPLRQRALAAARRSGSPALVWRAEGEVTAATRTLAQLARTVPAEHRARFIAATQREIKSRVGGPLDAVAASPVVLSLADRPEGLSRPR